MAKIVKVSALTICSKQTQISDLQYNLYNEQEIASFTIYTTLHLHLLSHSTSIPLQSHFLVAHLPLQAQGLYPDPLSLFVGRAGVLKRDFLLETTCSFNGRSFPSK